MKPAYWISIATLLAGLSFTGFHFLSHGMDVPSDAAATASSSASRAAAPSPQQANTPTPTLETISRYLDKSCAYQSLYYFRQQTKGVKSDDRHDLVHLNEIDGDLSMSRLIDVAKKMDIGLSGYQIDFTRFAASDIVVALLTPEQGVGHYVVAERLDETHWAVTDWPQLRYRLASLELQEMSQGYILLSHEVPKPKRQPLLVTDLPTVHVGEVVAGASVFVSIPLYNVGDAPLIIEDIHETCGCSQLSFRQATIQPGEVRDLRLHIQTSDRNGSWKEYLHIQTNEPGFPFQVIALEGIAIQVWSTDSESILFTKDDLFSGHWRNQAATIKYAPDFHFDLDMLDWEVRFPTDVDGEVRTALNHVEMESGIFTFNFLFSFQANTVYPTAIRGLFHVYDKRMPEAGVRLPISVMPPDHLSLRPSPILLSPSANEVQFQIGAHGVDWSKVQVMHPDAKFSINQNHIGLSLPSQVVRSQNRDANGFILRFTNSDGNSITISIPIFDLSS